MASKKITELSAAASVTATDLLITVDTAGPTTYKITMVNFFGSVPCNANFTQNVTSEKYFTTNNLVVTKNTTPANSTHGVVSGDLGVIWSDGSYLYVQANNTHYKRAALSTW